MNKSFIDYIVNHEDLKTYHYKIILLLSQNEYTQGQISKLLNLKKQNVYRYIKDLQDLGLIKISSTMGKNKFYRIITDINQINQLPLKGQMFIK